MSFVSAELDVSDEADEADEFELAELAELVPLELDSDWLDALLRFKAALELDELLPDDEDPELTLDKLESD